jgi:O-acetyl-ADP-ribose deacetylase (regulator of RNase III)
MTPSFPEHIQTVFQFGGTTVRILFGDLLSWPDGTRPDGLVTAEDNYFTMAGGVAQQLCQRLGQNYALNALEASPTRAGEVFISAVTRKADAKTLAQNILHAVIYDYNGVDQPLYDLVYGATFDCLQLAESNALTSLAFPALGVGGGLMRDESAEAMCEAIKEFLGMEHGLKDIRIVLHWPEGQSETDQTARQEALQTFLLHANFVLGTPYDPGRVASQARDFYGLDDEIETIQAVLRGDQPGKRHIALMGGLLAGKEALMEQLFHRVLQPDNPLPAGRFFVQVGLGTLSLGAGVNLLYRKLVSAMANFEWDEAARKELWQLYADPQIDCAGFLAFLTAHADRYGEVVFLVDGLPTNGLPIYGLPTNGLPIYGLPTEEQADQPDGVMPPILESFYKNLECLQDRVRFIIKVNDSLAFEQVAEQILTIAPTFSNALEVVWVRCASPADRTQWVKSIYQRYLGVAGEPPLAMVQFVEEEAGYHPYLIQLACYAILRPLKREALLKPEQLEKGWERSILGGVIQEARKWIDPPRRDFFAQIIDALPRQGKLDLYYLAQAVQLEGRSAQLGSDLAAGDLNARATLTDLMTQTNPRDLLHAETLDWLFHHGYIIRPAPGREDLCAPALVTYALETLGRRPLEDQPLDVTISLISLPASGPGKDAAIRTLFNNREARVLSAEKPLSADLRKAFMDSFNRFLKLRNGQANPDPSRHTFRDAEEVGNFLLTQFASLAVKRYLVNPPENCYINFLVDNTLQDLPWELMLEAAYAGEIPFRVGRSIISDQPLGNVRPPVRDVNTVRVLLIGNPTGDLEYARYEIETLAGSLGRDGRFSLENEDVLIGPEACQRIRVLNALSSGRYGLVHYSGHSRFAGSGSAWVLSDGEVATDQLTNAAQAAPPVMVFSSSCVSGAGGETAPVEYEDQAFDLPGAFLNAGVEAYLGTLWEVDAQASFSLVETFYTQFISGDDTLGECLRRARQALKERSRQTRATDWLAFILYGDPRLYPADLFPALRNEALAD